MYGSFPVAPGGGLAIGLILPGDGWAVDLGARGDILVGAASEGVLPIGQISVGLRLGG